MLNYSIKINMLFSRLVYDIEHFKSKSVPVERILAGMRKSHRGTGCSDPFEAGTRYLPVIIKTIEEGIRRGKANNRTQKKSVH